MTTSSTSRYTTLQGPEAGFEPGSRGRVLQNLCRIKRKREMDKAEYEAAVKEFLTICMREVPVVPLNQPIHDVALKKGVGGYQFWFHREPDYRQFAKV